MKNNYIDWKKLSFKCYCGNAPKWAQIPYNTYEWCYELVFPKFRDNWAWKLRYKLNPRQKWIKKYVTYENFSDKPELIGQFLFGCVQHFMDKDGEDCFSIVDWEATPEHSKFAKELRECHYYITVERPALETRIDEELTKASDRAGPMEFRDAPEFGQGMREMIPSKYSYEELYGEMNKLEKKLDELDSKWLTWIVTERNMMWC